MREETPPTICTPNGPVCPVMSRASHFDDTGKLGFYFIQFVRGWDKGAGWRRTGVFYRYGRKATEKWAVKCCPFCGGDLALENVTWIKRVRVVHENGFTTVDESEIEKTLAELGPTARVVEDA